MIKNKKAETILSVIIWVFILTFVLLWITNLMIESNVIIDKFNKNRDINILKQNSINIIKNIDTSSIAENSIFYIYRNKWASTFETQTWSEYKYVDRFWDYISDLTTFEWNIYSRIFYLERDDNSVWDVHQVIKASIKRLIKK
jgi:hypothetical protein